MMVKRYDMVTEYNKFACEDQVVPVEDNQGEYVRFEDYAVLEHNFMLMKRAYARLHEVHLGAMELLRKETEGE